MRPIKLTMTAFGPYKETETIDFSQLDGYDLFVISGKTGAGKTTIFDGICFALYGSASGQDRENNRMLRSDFADDNTHTAVELIFELKNNTYRIFRQLAHQKAGNKTATGEKYEFYQLEGDREIPIVDRQMVSEINKKVESLIGLTYDQFKQIVMLPQGEFRKLLTSETENKEAILRRLFKTESYTKINSKLNDRRQDAEHTYKEQKYKLDTYIVQIPEQLPVREENEFFSLFKEGQSAYYNVHHIVEGLDKEIAYYLDTIQKHKAEYDRAVKQYDEQQTKLHEAKAINDKFNELDEKLEMLAKLKELQPSYLAKEKKLEAATKASHLTPYEKQAKNSLEEVKLKEKQHLVALTNKENADKYIEQAVLLYKQEEKKQAERDELSKTINKFEQFLPTVQAMDNQKKQLAQDSKNLVELKKAIDHVGAAINKKKEWINQTAEKIKENEQAVKDLSKKQLTLERLRPQARLLKDYIKYEKEHPKFKNILQEKEKQYLIKKKQYNDAEKAWISDQASMLADHLHDGEACPVCGSIDHPKKATAKEGMVTRDQIEALKKETEQANEAYQKALRDYEFNKDQMIQKEKELNELDIQIDQASTTYEMIITQGKHLKEEVDQLETQDKELKDLKEIYEMKQKNLEQDEAEKSKKEQEFNDNRLIYQAKKVEFETKISQVPEDVRQLDVLQTIINETTERRNLLEKSWKQAQNNLQQAREKQTKADTDLHHATSQLKEAKDKKAKADQEFSIAREEAGFLTIEAYYEAWLEEDERDALKESIKQFNDQLQSVSANVTNLKEGLKDKRRTELTELEQSVQSLKDHYEKALDRKNKSEDLYEKSNRLKTNILRTNEEVDKAEKQLNIILDLYDVLRGQNDLKLSFERYLQIEYLEQIIAAANERLRSLSNGQFLLTRSDRTEAHGRQSGLALDVYDAYTDTTRDVKTLSGGEKFNASLSLALGMSDVIQSFQGNISINTMFIDEGFGSLDEESLHKSIDTLAELQQSGRMIGVISHVQELKTIFPAILEVLKTKEGYSQTRFLIK